MDELTKRYEQLVSENAKLRKENDVLKQNQMQHCRGCRMCVLHKCGAFWWCRKINIAVDRDNDGCGWWVPI